MTVDPQLLARRLRFAREGASLSQQAVAERIGVPRTAISQIESARRSVTSLELAQLARLYGKAIQYFFEPTEPEDDDLIVTLFRVVPGLQGDDLLRSAIQPIIRLCEEGMNLARMLDKRPRVGPPTYELPDPGGTYEAVKQGESVASEERKRLSLFHHPISEIADLLSAQEMWITTASLPDEVSGLFFRGETVGMSIVVNADHPVVRRRFSYAHEYAHALMDRSNNVTVSSRENSSDLVEKRANAFAAAFLMPPEGVSEAVGKLEKGGQSRDGIDVFNGYDEAPIPVEKRVRPGSQQLTYQDLAWIAHHFRVSYHAAVFRMKNLKYINQDQCERLLGQVDVANDFKEFVLEGESEPGAYSPRGWLQSDARELVSDVAHLALEAYRLEEVSRGKLIELADLLVIERKRFVEMGEAMRVKD